MVWDVLLYDGIMKLFNIAKSSSDFLVLFWNCFTRNLVERDSEIIVSSGLNLGSRSCILIWCLCYISEGVLIWVLYYALFCAPCGALICTCIIVGVYVSIDLVKI